MLVVSCFALKQAFFKGRLRFRPLRSNLSFRPTRMRNITDCQILFNFKQKILLTVQTDSFDNRLYSGGNKGFLLFNFKEDSFSLRHHTSIVVIRQVFEFFLKAAFLSLDD